MKKRVLGVIGGLGPQATVRFQERVVEMTDAAREQDNADMIIYNFPSIPDRTGYILGSSLNSPLPGLLNCARALDRQGVCCIAIPCVTAHYFHRELQNAVSVPIINAAAETAGYLKSAGVARAGIMATDGTVQSRLLTKEMEFAGINPILPSKQRQADVMHLIYENMKAGKAADMDRFRAVWQELTECGSEVIVLGCTELSLIRRQHPLEGEFLDMMDVMVRESILCCGKKLKPQFMELLKGGKHHADQHSGISGGNRKANAG